MDADPNNAMSTTDRRVCVSIAVILLLLCGAGLMVAQDGSEAEPVAVMPRQFGKPVASFVLPDAAGKRVGSADFSASRCLAIVFLGTECPIANQYLPALSELQQKYPAEKLQLIGVNANPSDTADEIAAHAQEFGINFPVLVDAEQSVLSLLGAKRTCEVFLLDQRRTLRYRGRIDDQFGYSYKRDQPGNTELTDALDAVLAGEAVATTETEAQGCLITRRLQVAEQQAVNYAEHVAPVLAKHCVDCHHPGTAAPFALTTYEAARDWSAMLREVVAERRMPPWHADERFDHFANSRRLTQTEIDTIIAWVEAGAPSGDLAQLPPAPAIEEGWRIGKPDVVFEMPEEFTVKAKGEVRYQYFVTPTNFTEDMWIQAGEARPGNRSVVHHIIVFARNPENHKEMEWITSTAPGAEPTIFPQGLGRKIPAGSELVWQVHYTATGKKEVDRSEVGFVFCKQPPEHHVRNHGIDNHRFQIPPQAENHAVESSYTVPRGAEVMLLSMYPHMHLRGKSFEYFVKLPGQDEETLLSIPQYDFNWQNAYILEKPLRLPGGSRIRCVAHFDNSADNPANPDSSSTVTWGDQTWEEMMIGYVDYYIVDGQKRAREK